MVNGAISFWLLNQYFDNNPQIPKF